MRALVYGAMNPDLVHEVDRVPERGDDLRSTSWQLTWGGKAANAAVALAEWGVETRLLGLVIGDDALGDALLGLLDRPNLDLSFIERDGRERTRHCVILVTPDRDRTIVCAGYDGARWQGVDDRAWRGVDAVLIDGFGGAAAAGIAAAARERSIPTVWLDAPHPPPVPIDLVVWSAHEHEPGAAAAIAAQHAATLLTAGAGSIRAFWPREEFEVVPPQVTPVDSTGAGDVFAAGCTYGVGKRWDRRRIVEWAAAAGAAAASLERTGVPTVEQIERLLG